MSHRDLRECRADRSGIGACRETGTSGTVRFASAGDHRAVSDFDERVRAQAGERLHRRAPAHRHRDVHRRGGRASRRRRRRRPRRRSTRPGPAATEGHVGSTAARPSAASCISGVWNAPPTLNGVARFTPSSLAWAERRVEPFGRARDHDLPGRVVVGDPARVGRGACTRSSACSTVAPSSAAMRPGCASAAACVSSARRAANRTPSSRGSAPDAMSAVT